MEVDVDCTPDENCNGEKQFRRAALATELYRAVRYRNYAEELRIIAADLKDTGNRQILLGIADDYDRMASELEALAEAKSALIDRQPL